MKKEKKYQFTTNLTLRPVRKKDYEFLYRLLKERKSNECISHRDLPTYEGHVKFNNSKPYKVDYIIWLGEEPIGRFYITDRFETGIKVLSEHRELIIKEILYSLLKNLDHKLYFNVSPKDRFFKTLLKQYGLVKKMETYATLS